MAYYISKMSKKQPLFAHLHNFLLYFSILHKSNQFDIIKMLQAGTWAVFLFFDASMLAESEDFMRHNRASNEVRRRRQKNSNLKAFATLMLSMVIAVTFGTATYWYIESKNNPENSITIAAVSKAAAVESGSATEEEIPTEEKSTQTIDFSNSSAENQTLSVVSLFFNGVWIKTYSTKEEALSAPIELSSFTNDSEKIFAQAVVGFDQPVVRVILSTERDNGAKVGVDESILWKGSDWSKDLNFSVFISGTIIVTIKIEDADTNLITTQYFAFQM